MEHIRFESANANFITDYLAVGGDLSKDHERATAQATELIGVGAITHLLDVRIEAAEALWGRFPHIRYQWDGIDDAGQEVPAEWFERITTWADAAINDGGKVLTHCHMGINRGPSAGFAVLLRRGWDPVEAIGAIRNARPQSFVAYAEDALEWHLSRAGATESRRRSARKDLAAWRAQNPMDVRRVIRAGGHSTPGLAA